MANFTIIKWSVIVMNNIHAQYSISVMSRILYANVSPVRPSIVSFGYKSRKGKHMGKSKKVQKLNYQRAYKYTCFS